MGTIWRKNEKTEQEREREREGEKEKREREKKNMINHTPLRLPDVVAASHTRQAGGTH